MEKYTKVDLFLNHTYTIPLPSSESDILSLILPSMEKTNMLINIPALGHAGTGTRQTVWV